ncbi:hypothetical protein [Natronospora cellulosivora (SeqCode)]
MHLSREVEKLSGRLLSESKPIVGKKVFSHESGIHVDGLLKDSRTMRLFHQRIKAGNEILFWANFLVAVLFYTNIGKKGE